MGGREVAKGVCFFFLSIVGLRSAGAVGCCLSGPVCTGWCGTGERKFSGQHQPASYGMKTPIDPLFPIHSMPDPFNPSLHHPLSIYGSIDTAEFGNQAQERNGHQ